MYRFLLLCHFILRVTSLFKPTAVLESVPFAMLHHFRECQIAYMKFVVHHCSFRANKATFSSTNTYLREKTIYSPSHLLSNQFLSVVSNLVNASFTLLHKNLILNLPGYRIKWPNLNLKLYIHRYLFFFLSSNFT